VIVTTTANVAALRRSIPGSVYVQLALATAPRRLCPTRQAALFERVRDRAGELVSPRGTRTVRAVDTPWRPFAPGVDYKLMRADSVRGVMTALLRMNAGAVFAAHDHPRAEHCFVVEGEIRIGAHRLRSGDMHIAEPGSHHEDTHCEGGALLLVHAALPAEPCAA
jgi:anti-sigma factor ChrR (cupin superfamily)